MNRYAISGADKKTGSDVKIEVLAESDADARKAAVSEGILITECKLLGDSTLPANRSEGYLREIVIWLRFFGILTALAVFAAILKVVMTK